MVYKTNLNTLFYVFKSCSDLMWQKSKLFELKTFVLGMNFAT